MASKKDRGTEDSATQPSVLVSGEDYRLFFAADGGNGEVAIDDPLTLLVGAFVAELCRDEKRSQSSEIAARMGILDQIVEAGPARGPEAQ